VTLQQAHDVLRRQRPPVSASAAKWRAFHEKAARIYTSVAELDGDHHFEALAFAGMAREDAEKFGTEKVEEAAGGAAKPWRSE
jgi:hypothetical protein